MHALLAELERNDHLAGVVRGLRERTQGNIMRMGVAVDLHPDWLRAYRAEQAGLPDYDGDWFYRYWQALPAVDEPLDYSRIPRWWDHRSRAVRGDRKPSPFLLRIIRRPKRSPLEGEEEIRRLAEIAAEAEITTIVEARPPATLVGKPGCLLMSASSGSTGTLGGYVKDPASGRHYAMTAGHAVGPGPVAASPGGMLGQCTVHHAPSPLAPGIACGAAGTSCSLDVALVEVDPASSISTAAAIAMVDRGYRVSMKGASSGRRHYEIGPVLLDYEIGGHCFYGLTQFNACVSDSFLPISWIVGRTPPPRRGDSGAWLMHNKTEWAGMVVAADHLHGYAFDATTILDGIASRNGIHLQLP